METLQTSLFFKPILSSYPTYEEWKPKAVEGKDSDETFGSYPTYEEWKRADAYWAEDLIMGSYPTYEEWKQPVISNCPGSIVFVLILPMRNGNSIRICQRTQHL